MKKGKEMFKSFAWGCISFLIVGCASSTPTVNEPIAAKVEPTAIQKSLEKSNEVDNEPVINQEERIQEVYWKLIGIMGKAVVSKPNAREAYIILKLDKNRLQGFGGCNVLMGKYELKDEKSVSFSRVASTMMACPNLYDESAFLKVLEQVDGYTIKDGVLMLHKAKMAPLATFEAVYLP